MGDLKNILGIYNIHIIKGSFYICIFLSIIEFRYNSVDDKIDAENLRKNICAKFISTLHERFKLESTRKMNIMLYLLNFILQNFSLFRYIWNLQAESSGSSVSSSVF
jgi:hypothetical protein